MGRSRRRNDPPSAGPCTEDVHGLPDSRLLGRPVVGPDQNPEPATTSVQLQEDIDRSKYPTTVTYHIIGPNDREPESKYGTIVYRSKGQYLGAGGTAFLDVLPTGEVVKTPLFNDYDPFVEKDARRNTILQAEIYRKLGEHPRIPTIIAWDPSTCCLTMEYMKHGDLRAYVREHRDAILEHRRLNWSRQAAEGVKLLHDNDVVHCDLSPRNFLLDHELDLKIADFGGSSISGSAPSAFQGTRYCRPNLQWNDTPQPRDDNFALGSLVYFIMTSQYPYEVVPSDEVQSRFRTLDFPDVSHISCGSIIQRCWMQQVDATEVFEYFTRELP